MVDKMRNNRRAGHSFEKLVASLFRLAGYEHVVTTRAESKSRDDQGIDIMNKDEVTNGRLPYNVQCKNSIDRPSYDTLLAGMPHNPGVINAVFHKYTIKKGTLFVPRGSYVIVDMDDFMTMVADLKQLRELNKHLEDDSTNRR